MKRLLLLLFAFSFLSEIKASDTLTIRQIYNFEVGDTFDYLNYETLGDAPSDSGPFDTTYFYYQRNIIVNKIIASDSITYTVSTTEFNSRVPNYSIIDTVLITQLDSNAADTQLVFFSTHYLFPFRNIGNQSRCNLVDSSYFRGVLNWDSIVNDVNWYELAPLYGGYRFQKGLGMTYGYGINNDGADPVANGYNVLIYYSKGNTHAGTPYYNSTLGVNDISNISNIKVYPNPASDQLHLSMTNTNQYNTQFIITDILGQQLYAMPVIQDESKYDISKLYPGMYSWRLVSDNSVIKTGKIIKE